jgi:hypothetical protein
MNLTNYRQVNDTNNGSLIYLGQDVSIRTPFSLAYNQTTQGCYSLVFEFGIVAAMDAAYFTDALVVSSGDNLMCMKSKSVPILTR